MIPGLEPAEARDLVLSVGTHQGQRRLRPGQVAVLMNRALSGGLSRKEPGEALGLRDPSMIGRFLRLLELPPGTRDLVGWGRSRDELSLSVAAEVVSVPPRYRDRLTAAAQAHLLTKDEVRAVAQHLARSGSSLDEAIDAIVRLRPETVRRYVVLGTISDPAIRKRLAEASHEERQALFRESLGRLGIEAGGALRPTGFTLAREGEPFDHPDVLEQQLNLVLGDLLSDG